ncbi:SMI1/KNR4 family protein [Metabacillus fastidiosus]|uniref:SMI1/KNR4 family protein n=1 Tax=Metabacillus fastidiosus TaxID=1458 RepID=UPI003D2C7B1E
MTNLPDELHTALKEDIYKRENRDDVYSVLARLNVTASPTFVEFYKKYSGSFWGNSVPYELLDLCEDINNIESYTEICRKEHCFPDIFLVLSELSAGAALVLDSVTDKVYEVDFEGGNESLLNGSLKACWPSFYEFLKDYFEGF